MGASLLLIEALFVLLGVFGVWLMNPAVAYVVAGILGIVAIERAQARRDQSVRAAAKTALTRIGRAS